MESRDLAAAVLAILVWGLNFVPMKLGLAYFTPFQLGFARFIFSFLPLALWIAPPAVRLRWILLFGLTQGLGQFGLLFIALRVGMTTALASVLMQTQVFFTAAFGLVLLHERIHAGLKFGMLLAFAGLACFAASAGARIDVTNSLSVWGLTLAIAAAAMWAGANIVVRKAQAESADFDALSLVVWSSLVPLLPFLALTYWLDPVATRGRWYFAPPEAWVSPAVRGWLGTNLAFGLWTYLLKRYPASLVAPFSLGIPVLGLLAGVLVLGEAVSLLQWTGAGFVLMALMCVLFQEQ
jgi:O-acetylserine/cysteine efflux transporter